MLDIIGCIYSLGSGFAYCCLMAVISVNKKRITQAFELSEHTHSARVDVITFLRKLPVHFLYLTHKFVWTHILWSYYLIRNKTLFFSSIFFICQF
ncbi:hypothetical protein EB796_017747 [Bugula neritina]|uniref:Uncharacterized protein n=1 Tax=Bugula neritina TaxID=10212 RepID=A0A7J7JCF9_BUGNE|nr:hypothetical protein EB796_017747 [Bugula neritina]